MGELKDKTGLHMNVMLGALVVDRKNYAYSAEATWGLFHSGKHFGAIAATVNDWCNELRSEPATPVAAEDGAAEG